MVNIELHAIGAQQQESPNAWVTKKNDQGWSIIESFHLELESPF